MGRTADYTIQGFLYQFHKCLLEVLGAADGAEVTIEGIIEDVEVAIPKGVVAIQCKYHETKSNFAQSDIFKPLLQMMLHFLENPGSQVSYRLFAHFPNPPAGEILTEELLQSALASKDKELDSYCGKLNGKVNLTEFLEVTKLEFGPSWDQMVESVRAALISAGIPQDDVDTLAYPNALQAIADLSIQHHPDQRRITKPRLLSYLRKVKSTAISRWTLSLRNTKQILAAKRKQLRLHLNANARRRYFIFHCESVEDFDENIVGFTTDFVAKYNFKPSHIHTPLLCLDTSEAVFRDIQWRLFNKDVVATDGYIGTHLSEAYLFRDPLSDKIRKEFVLRLLRWEPPAESMLRAHKGDDLFIVGSNRYGSIDTKDVNVEYLESLSVKQLAYIMGVSDAC